MDNLDKNYKYFKENKKDLIKKFPEEYLVIVDENVVFHSKDRNNAIEFVKTLKACTYILQKCEQKEEDNIQMFHTRVSF